MEEISLREYNREIESLIDSGRTDEAIAHARSILKEYPKHIGTYRLLGKAYLEIQRYSDASDIFQRVLSSVPDDFVANLGMSIIREDEGNLDAAIWHMERAFEVQPSNGAIQAELKRLYGRRDGFEPPKIHLTRGALARMYAKGSLHRQAIAEVRAALAEGPQRPDLLVLLARLYQEAERQLEAVETCSNLINKLPDCMEANRILAEILPRTERAAEAKIYQERLESLDPYARFTGPDYPSPDSVPDSRVSVEKYRWTPGETVLGAPEERELPASPGVEIPGEAAGEVPEWMASAAGGQASPDVLEEDSAAEMEAESLPDWLEEEDEQPVAEQTTTPAEKEDDLEDLEPAEIPDWMQSLAPAEGETSEESAGEAAGTFDWPEEAGEAATFESKEAFDLDADADVEVPDWLSELEQEEDEEAVESEPSLEGEMEGAEVPEWLNGVEASDMEAEMETPEWLKEIEEEEGEGIEAESVELAQEALPETEPEEVETAQEEVEALDMEAEAGVESPPMGALDDEEAALAWLESLAQKQGVAEEELLTSPEARRDAPPDWVQELAEEETGREVEAELGAGEPADFDEFEMEEEEEAPVAFGEAEAGEEEEVPVEFGEAEAGEEEEVPEWLEAAETTEEAPEEAEELPDWLHGAQAAPPPEDLEAVIEEEQAGLEKMEAEMPEWLQEITEEDTSIPDWLQGFEETLEEEEIEFLKEEGVAPSTVQAEVTFEGQKELPDWLRDLGEEAEPEAGYEREAPEPYVAEGQYEEEPILGDTKPMRVVREELEEASIETQAALEDTQEAGKREEEDLMPASVEEEEEAAWAWPESVEAREEELEAEVTIPEEELEQEGSIPEEELEEEVIVPEAEWEQEAPVQEEELAGEPAELIHEAEREAEEALEPGAQEIEAAERVDEFAEEMIAEEPVAPVEEIAKAPEEIPPVEEQAPLDEQAPPDRQAELEEQAQAPVPELIEAEFLIDINSASLPELEKIPGIGFTVAQNIVAHRETYGPFQDLDELQNVSGIGPDTAEELKKWVVLEAVPEEMPAPEDPHLATLNSAREGLDAGDIGEAVGHYNQLIRDEQLIDEVVEDLQKAIDRHPMEIEVYQALGDALMRKNQLQEALDIYTKAEELLR